MYNRIIITLCFAIATCYTSTVNADAPTELCGTLFGDSRFIGTYSITGVFNGGNVYKAPDNGYLNWYPTASLWLGSLTGNQNAINGDAYYINPPSGSQTIDHPQGDYAQNGGGTVPNGYVTVGPCGEPEEPQATSTEATSTVPMTYYDELFVYAVIVFLLSLMSLGIIMRPLKPMK